MENNLKRLFLKENYLDAWHDYDRSLRKNSFVCWDYIILTASNEAQAEGYLEQINYRICNGLLSKRTEYAVLPDPDGKRVGSGGATLNVLKYLVEKYGIESLNKRILVIHSGGDSKRVPQYSACGKLFSPVPRELPNGRPSSLFDEFIIGVSGIPGRMSGGMLVMSGDVLLLFNSLQIDLQYHGAAAISIKAEAATGSHHGVYLNEGGVVKKFLHKCSEKELRKQGAVNEQGNVDIDTGAVMLDSDFLSSLYSLISTDGKIDNEKFDKFVNEEARISFYGDFMYPLAADSTLEDYYAQAAEGELNEQLHDCRTILWDLLSQYSMKVICLSPAEFIHFGTTKELLELVSGKISDYELLGWGRQVCTNRPLDTHYSAHNSLIEESAVIGEGAYIENSIIGDGCVIGKGSVISNITLKNTTIPDNKVVHGLKLKDGKYTVRVYDVDDNPKENNLWEAKKFPVFNSPAEFTCYEDVFNTEGRELTSLKESFNNADILAILPWHNNLEDLILSRLFIKKLNEKATYEDALSVFGRVGISEDKFKLLMQEAKNAEMSLKMRIYYALSKYLEKKEISILGEDMDTLMAKSFDSISDTIIQSSKKYIRDNKGLAIAKDEVKVSLPVRVNWGGGWTDTPPQCNECGGTVLNAAISLNGILPIQVEVRKLKESHIEFASEDIGVSGTFDTIDQIRDCHNPYDFFALHKAALIACGIIPMEGNESLDDILKRLGGGIYLSTRVVGIPKGSGLGTSSILSGACVKAIHEFLGLDISEEGTYDIVLTMEQIMSTGGGWQDQVGGLTPGIKYITTAPGTDQKIKVTLVEIPKEAKDELSERFALVYTGQRRLARNLLRDVIGNYIGGRAETIDALKQMKDMAALMRAALEMGDIDRLAELFNKHWELSLQLDMGATNTCIDQIFTSIDEYIDGKFIAGAGGGGFLQVILKKGVKKEEVSKRLHEVFQDNGVDVWECEFV